MDSSTMIKDKKAVMMHLREHPTYPATRAELIEACNELSDFSDSDKQWFMDNLPEGTYKSAEEVTKAIGM